MRILLLGGTGFIGQFITQRLAEAGHAVAVFHRGKTTGTRSPSLQHIHGDRANLPVFRATFQAWKPDVLIDLIAYTEQEALKSVEVFEGLLQRVIVISSQDVYRAYDRFRGAAPGPPDPTPLAEDAPLRETRYPYRDAVRDAANWLYHYDKILVEQAYQSARTLHVDILRLPQVYGPGDPRHRVWPYLKQMEADASEILLDLGQASWRWTRGYVENIAAAVAQVATTEPSAAAVYNLGEAETDTEAAWIRRIGAVVGWDGEIVEREQPEAVSNWQQHLVFDTRCLRQRLGFAEPVAAEEAIIRTVAWEREQRT